jgi:hypothetical protein
VGPLSGCESALFPLCLALLIGINVQRITTSKSAVCGKGRTKSGATVTPVEAGSLSTWASTPLDFGPGLGSTTEPSPFRRRSAKTRVDIS